MVFLDCSYAIECVTVVLGRGYTAATNDTTQQSGQTPDKEVKVRCSRYRPGVAQRVGRGIALLFLDRGTRRG